MSEFEVIAEASPSGRASCQSRGCGEKIGKGEFRVKQKAEGARFPIVKHYHVRKLSSLGLCIAESLNLATLGSIRML